MDWYTWVFSGIGVVVLGFIYKFFIRSANSEIAGPTNNTQNMNLTINQAVIQPEATIDAKSITISQKAKFSILFIDDDTKFKVVQIFKTSGWSNTSIVKDIKSLEEDKALLADLIFVDINGVGKLMGFKDEGLGLAKALKEKYDAKYIVIYSAASSGERFHGAFRICDDQLEKNAEPYEFLTVAEKAFKQAKNEH